jgi:S-formylglutathione hydrolase FrmB
MKKKAYLIFLFFFTSNYLFSFQIDTLSVFSFSMNKEIKNIVIKPDFHKNKKDIPVVYLLHGAYGNYTDWTSKTKGLGEYSDNNNIIIVCPDGGYNSWYFDSPIDKNYMYETYIVNELIPFVDSNYNTSKERNYRAISGLSM